MTPDNPWQDNPWETPSGAAASQDDVAAQFAPPPIDTARVDVLDFLDAMRANRRKTILLIACMLALSAAFGYVLGWGWDLAIGRSMAVAMQSLYGKPDWMAMLLTPSPTGVMLALAMLAAMMVWTLVTLWRADKMVLNMAGAQDVSETALPQLHNVVEEMAIAAGLPKPRVVLLPTSVPNAFATGLRQDRAVIGVTEGLLQTLNRRELQGVVAHEMGHVMNGDMRYATIMAVMTGVLVFVAEIVMYSRRMFFFGNSDSRGGRRGGHPVLMLVMLVVFMVTAILVPILARMIQMGISRQREYLADATAVQLTRDPGGLISALQKIAENQHPSPNIKSSLEPLYIITPMKMWQNGNMAWFSTHPPLEKRIERLKALE